MVVVVVGGGAVGSFLAWALEAGGQDVRLIRRGHDGGPRPIDVAVTDPNGQRRAAWVTIAAAPTQVDGRPDVIVLAVKMYDLATAAASLATWPRVPVVTVQNGIGAEELVAGARATAGLIAASLTAAVESSAEGEWRWLRRGGLGLAPVQGVVGKVIEQLGSATAAAGLPTRTFQDAAAMKWSKLLGNLVANSTAAILDMDVGAIYRHPGLFRVERAQIAEALAVMQRLGLRPVPLPGADVRLLIRAFRLPDAVARLILSRRLAGARGGKDPSLLLHVRSRGGPSEVEWMNGAVARTGDRLGVTTPVNRRLTELVDEVSRDPERRAWFRHQPYRLLEALGADAV